MRGNHEECLREHVTAAHATAHLVKLADTEVVRVHDDNRIRVRYVEARLDDARAHQNIEILRKERVHHALKFAVFHLAVCHGHAGVRNPVFNVFGKHVDALDAVVHDKDLATARQFVFYRGGKNHVVALEELGFHG